MHTSTSRPSKFIFPLIIGLAALGCKDPAESVPAAKVDKAPAKAAAKEAPEEKAKPGETIALSPDNTKVMFVGSKVTGSHEGGFKQLSGSLTLDRANLANSTAEITIDMKSTYTDQKKLTGHLMSPDFFDVESFPTTTFKITSLKEGASEGGTHTLSGELTLHGVTKPISFPATVEISDANVAAKAEFSINRKDFGIMYPGMKDDLIRDGVIIKLDVNVSRNKS